MTKIQKLALAGILGLGLWLRIFGLGFGNPILSNLYIRPDESLIAASAAEIVATDGKPGTFAYPALMQEFAAVVYHAGFALGRAFGWIGAASLPLHFGSDPTPYYMVLRWISALCGTATIGVVFLLARRLASFAPAAMAALLLAVSPLAVRDSHFGVTDTPYVLLCTLTMLFVFRFLDAAPEGENAELRRAYLLLVAAVATKYAALLMAPVVLGAVVWKRRRVPWIGAFALTLAGLAVFFALNPYLLLMHERAVRELRYILTALYLWQPGDPAWTLPSALEQIWRPLRHGPGGLAGLSLAGCAALWLSVRWSRGERNMKALFVVQALFSTFVVLLPFQHTVPYRYLLPALPWIAVLCAVAVHALPKAHGWAAAALALALVPLPLLEAWKMDALLASKDTRTLAWEWIAANVPRELPVLWAGGPECEPHFDETAASIQRRIDWVHERYGPFSGNIVSQPYRMMAAARAGRAEQGYEVYRNPSTGQTPGDEFLFVTPYYPLAMAKVMYELPAGRKVRVLREYRIDALSDPAAPHELDRIDAFFLPFRPSGVLRPGPGLHLRWVRLERLSD